VSASVVLLVLVLVVKHLTIACAQEASPCGRIEDGVRPFKGNRQRLDRYGESGV
jgi:hypothetical protein